jgi:DNA-directed RNA polymerase subunit L
MSKLDANIVIKKKQESINGYNNNYVLFTINGKDINYIIINTIRRTILTLVPTYAFDPENIIIEKNTSVYNNDYMRLRLSSIPLINKSYDPNKMIIKNDSSILYKVLYLEEEMNTINYENKNNLTKEEEQKKKENLKKILDNLQINIDAKNNSSDIISITTDDVKFTIDNNQIKSIYPNPILILKLKPEQSRLHFKSEEFKATCISSLNIPLKNAIYLSCLCSYEEVEPTKFEFKICSTRQISEEMIINHACKIIIMKLEKIKNKIINAINNHKSSEVLNEAQLIIENENHTMGNLITRVIQDHPDIEFCGYNVDHLYINDLTLRYKTNGKSIIDILEISINYLINIYKHLIKQIEKFK